MGGARIYKAASPFNASELRDMDAEQSFDTVFLAHVNYPPPKLIREGHTDWQFMDVSFGPTITAPVGVGVADFNPNVDADNSGNAYFPRTQRYVVAAVDDATNQVSLPSAEVNAFNDLTLKRNYNEVTWTANGADRYFVYKANNEGGLGFIGETTGTTFKDDNITPDLTDGPRVGHNPFAVAGDYPSTVFFFEQRLGYARTLNNPNALIFSRSADLENFDYSRPLVEDDSITIRLVATKVNAVNQVVPLDELLALTSNGLFKIVGSNQDYLAASPPPRQRRQNGRGASRLKPVVADNVVFYTPEIGDEVRAINFSFEIDGYKTDEMSIFSPHFFRGHSIVAWAYADDPLSIVVAIRDDGKALCFTWQREQDVWGWTLWETAGKFLDVCVIPEAGSDGKAEHRIYFVVERVIAGVTRRFVERMASSKWVDQQDACYLDCAFSVAYDEPTATGFFPDLAGETVSIFADGDVYSNRVIDEDGYVEITSPSTRWHVGLSYTSLIETMPISFNAQGSGFNAGRAQQIGDVVLRLVRSRGVKAGVKEDDLLPLKTRTNEPLGSPKSLLTGDYTMQVPAEPTREATVFVAQTYPLPMTLTGVFPDVVLNEN